MATTPVQLDTFIQNFGEQFDLIEPGSLGPDTVFKELEEWGSMQALIVITSFDEHYEITLNGEEIKSASTLQDLYTMVTSKMA